MQSDYTKSIETFDEWVAADETAFRPLGTKIGEYAKRKKADDSKSKGKGKAKPSENGRSKGAWENCETTDDDAVVFEAYQVRGERTGRLIRGHRWCQVASAPLTFLNTPDDLQNARLQRVPSSYADLRPSVYRRWLVH